MFEWAIRILLFLLAVTASGWRALAWRLLIAAGLVLAAFLVSTEGRLSLQVPEGDANIAAGIVLYFAIMWVPGGFLARAASLWARALGHPRPWSLWIEAVFFLGWPALIQMLLEVV